MEEEPRTKQRREGGKTWLLLLWLGCTELLTLGDQFHTQFGIIAYPNGVLFGQAWWVTPGFALAVLGFLAVAWPFARTASPPNIRHVAIQAAWFFVVYAMSGVFGTWSVTLTLAFTALWALRMMRRPDRGLVIRFSLLIALLGTLGEEALHATGVCRYLVRDIGLVPLWLPALYLNGAPFALDLACWLRAEPTPKAT